MKEPEGRLADSYSSSLICGVCLEEYKDPRALPCLHTFCHDCLQGIHRRSRGPAGLACPCCREVFQLARTSELRRNFHVSRLLEMRPLLAMGIGLAEEFSAKARTQLAQLPDEAELAESAGQCRQELTQLRKGQRTLEAFFEEFEAAVRAERESARGLYSAAKAEVKARRKWARDCRERRSVSERLIECAKSGRHQSLSEIIAEFRSLNGAQPQPPSPAEVAAGSGGPSSGVGSRPPPELPNPATARRRLQQRLRPAQPPRPPGKIGNRQLQQQQQRAKKLHRRRLRQRRQQSVGGRAAGKGLFGLEDSDSGSAAQLFVHTGLAGFMYYGDQYEG